VNILTPVAVRVGSISWMPKLLPQITATDKFIQRVTKGKVTILDIAGLPNLTLTVKGRKSGVPRTTPLLCTPHESGYLVGVLADGSTRQAAVREITGAERDQKWAVMTKTWPNYKLYAERTDRTIPVFFLDLVA